MIRHRRPFGPKKSQRLDWAIFMTESTRGWRQAWWRVVKWALELGI